MDISITIFLAAASCSGGDESSVNISELTGRYKRAAASALAYPANTSHLATLDTRGARDVAVAPVQRQLRDPA